MFVMIESLFALTGSLTATTLTVVMATLLFMNPSFTVTWMTRSTGNSGCSSCW